MPRKALHTHSLSRRRSGAAVCDAFDRRYHTYVACARSCELPLPCVMNRLARSQQKRRSSQSRGIRLPSTPCHTPHSPPLSPTMWTERKVAPRSRTVMRARLSDVSESRPSLQGGTRVVQGGTRRYKGGTRVVQGWYKACTRRNNRRSWLVSAAMDGSVGVLHRRPSC